MCVRCRRSSTTWTSCDPSWPPAFVSPPVLTRRKSTPPSRDKTASLVVVSSTPPPPTPFSPTPHPPLSSITLPPSTLRPATLRLFRGRTVVHCSTKLSLYIRLYRSLYRTSFTRGCLGCLERARENVFPGQPTALRCTPPRRAFTRPSSPSSPWALAVHSAAARAPGGARGRWGSSSAGRGTRRRRCRRGSTRGGAAWAW